MSKPMSRRVLLQGGSATLVLSGFLEALPRLLLAEDTATRTFDPKPGTWRNFEVVTTVQLRDPPVDATVWVPVPTINTHWQRSLSSETSGNAAQTGIETDPKSGARFVVAQFKTDTPSPSLQVTSRVQTMDRAVDWKRPQHDQESAATLRRWMQPSALVPTDGIVRKTALQITKGAHTDVDKAHRIYDWIIVSTYREPKVRGCGVVASVPSRVTRRLSFSMPRSPWRNAAPCGPLVSADKRRWKALLDGDEKFVFAIAATVACLAPNRMRRTRFLGSGHFNISV